MQPAPGSAPYTHPVRIALVTDTFAPRVGGIEAQVGDLAAALRAAGEHVDVLTATGGPAEPGVIRFPGPGGAVPNPMSRTRVRALLAGYDVVHVHVGVVSPMAAAAAADALGLGLPVVVTVHSMLASARAVLAPGLRRWASDGAVLTAVSTAAAKDVSAGAGAPVSVLPNAIHVADWRPTQEPPAAPVTFACTTRFVERKRVVPLVRAFARAAELVEPGAVRLVVAGDGPLRSLAREATRRHGVAASIDLPGKLPREQLREVLGQAHAFVSPVRLEAFGIAALEARAMGLPVVAYRGSGLAELVEDDVTGILVDGDTGLTAAMARFVREPQTLARMRAACTEPPPYDWGQVVPQVQATYARALARRA